MKSKTFVGALLLSVALCCQGFAIELGGNLLGLRCGGCGSCGCCEPAAKCCAPEPAPTCCAAPAPTCCAAAPTCCESKCGCQQVTPVRDLFCGLKDLFDCHKCGCGCGCAAPTCCAAPVPACCAPAPACCAPAPACCEKPACCCKPLFSCCKPTCCEKPACGCGCEKKCCCHPLADLVNGLFACHNCCKPACGCGCATGGCATCGGGAPVAAPAPAPTTAPAPAPAPTKEEALPKAPKATDSNRPNDPSASLLHRGNMYQTSPSVVLN